MSEDNIYVGLPTMCLLPMNKTRFKAVGGLRIVVPRSGTYNELSPEVFKEDAGEFDLLSDNILYLPAITKVLLATGEYPNLKANQIFSPSALSFEDDEAIIEGMVLEILNVVQ
jgi:hypothetical protein